jgi:hypothetical protein
MSSELYMTWIICLWNLMYWKFMAENEICESKSQYSWSWQHGRWKSTWIKFNDGWNWPNDEILQHGWNYICGWKLTPIIYIWMH